MCDYLFFCVTVGEIVLTLVLSTLSIIVALWYESKGEPKLEFLVLKPKPILWGEKQTLFLNILIKNNPQKKWLLVRKTATLCHGDITYFDLGLNQIGKSTWIRWAGNPQPVKYDISEGNLVTLQDNSLLRISKYIDIPRDEQEEIDVAMRYLDNNKNAFAWNGDSYREIRINPILQTGEYYIKIKIICNENTTYQVYKLNNPDDIHGYSLTNAPKDIVGKLLPPIKHFWRK